MDARLEKKLLKTSTFEEFKSVAISNNIIRFEDFSIKVLKHMESLMPKNEETPYDHSDPREAFTKK
ncbi:hypothetical protein [Sporanaerobacter acetigenes]|uniref:hypothetical protein n=1 Tax=Sporanaerobacter acetigenes TaxID=165813 RepID=UPI001053CCB6|nr:hypothetical protein [Sporanaerobacter acetigenes]